jgi:hypothetical protein
MQTEAAIKIKSISTCGCNDELESMWRWLCPELKKRNDVERAYDTRKADLLREQKDAA